MWPLYLPLHALHGSFIDDLHIALILRLSNCIVLLQIYNSFIMFQQ